VKIKRWGRSNAVLAGVLLVLAYAVYANSFGNAFTNWDDDALVVNNQGIRSLSLENIKNIFTYRPGSTYQPVRVFSYALDYHFWQLNPLGYHIHSTLLHGLAGVFLFYCLVLAIPRIRGWDQRFSGQSEHADQQVRTIAFFTALLFLVHPVNVEAVVWLSGRKYVLMAFFLFLSFLLYIKSCDKGRYYKLFYVGSLVCCVLSALSSPVGVVGPGLFFLYEYCRDEAANPLQVLQKRLAFFLPYLVVGFLVLAIVFSALVSGKSGGAVMGHIQGDWVKTLMAMLRALFDYVRNLFMPLWLNPRYPDYVYASPWNVKILLPAAAALTLGGYLVWQVRVQGCKHVQFCSAGPFHAMEF